MGAQLSELTLDIRDKAVKAFERRISPALRSWTYEPQDHAWRKNVTRIKDLHTGSWMKFDVRGGRIQVLAHNDRTMG